MATFVATYQAASGSDRSIRIQAADLASARKLLRRRGIKATTLQVDEPSTPAQGTTQKQTQSGTKAGLLSLDLSAAFEKAPGVREKAVFASKLAALVDAARRGDLEAARRWHFQLLPLMRANFLETNPVPVKTAMAQLGHCGEGLRPPLGPMGETERARLIEALTSVGLARAPR